MLSGKHHQSRSSVQIKSSASCASRGSSGMLRGGAKDEPNPRLKQWTWINAPSIRYFFYINGWRALKLGELIITLLWRIHRTNFIEKQSVCKDLLKISLNCYSEVYVGSWDSNEPGRQTELWRSLSRQTMLTAGGSVCQSCEVWQLFLDWDEMMKDRQKLMYVWSARILKQLKY